MLERSILSLRIYAPREVIIIINMGSNLPHLIDVEQIVDMGFEDFEPFCCRSLIGTDMIWSIYIRRYNSWS